MAKRTSAKRTRKPARGAAKRHPRAPKKTARRPLGRPTKRRSARAAKVKPKRSPRPATPATRPKAARPAPRPRAKAASPARAAAGRSAKPPAPAHDLHPPTLARARRQLPDAERATGPLVDDRLVAEAKSGHDAVARSLKEHTETSPVLTAGDVDANWEDAYAVGDETPGGDNPTPDQNEVDAIGRALGTEYADGEELMGGDEIEERDEHRWELDPKSKEDLDDED